MGCFYLCLGKIQESFEFIPSDAIVPSIPSFLFSSDILAPNASAALLAKKRPRPTPGLFPCRLKGAKRSTLSSIPHPSSITSISNPKSFWELCRVTLFSLGVNFKAFCKKF